MYDIFRQPSLFKTAGLLALLGAFSASADHHNFESDVDRDPNSALENTISTEHIRSVDGTGRPAGDNTIRSVDGTGLHSAPGDSTDSVDGTGLLNDAQPGTIRSVDGTGRLRSGTDLSVANANSSEGLRSVDGTGRLMHLSPQSDSSAFDLSGGGCEQGPNSPADPNTTDHTPVDDSGCE